MKIANQFTVSAPIEQAWDVLCDLEQVIPLMPGAQLVGHEGDEYLGKVKVKVGPVTSEFSGKVRFVEQDREQRRAVIDGKGKESRGTGNAAATVTAQLQEAGDRTSVTVDTDLKIVGKLAQFGSGMLQQVSEKLLGQFVESLEAKLAAESAGSTATPAIRQRQQCAGADSGVAAKSSPGHWPSPARPSPSPSICSSLPAVTSSRNYGRGGRGSGRGAGADPVDPTQESAGSVTIPLLLRGVDLAAFAAALAARLRSAGVSVSASGQAGFVQALRQSGTANSRGALLGSQADLGQPDGRPRCL